MSGPVGEPFPVLVGLILVLGVVIGAIAIARVMGSFARGGDQWAMTLDRDLLQPGSGGTVTAVFRPRGTVRHGGIRAELRCVERYVYDRTETDAKGQPVVRRHTGETVLHETSIPVAAPGEVGPTGASWSFPLEIPTLAAPSFAGDTLRVTWTLRVLADVTGPDVATNVDLAVGAPVERLSAGVLDLEAGAPMIEAPVDGGTIAVEPVPFDLERGGVVRVTLQSPDRDSRGVRVRVVSRATVTHSGGVGSTAVAWEKALAAGESSAARVELVPPFAPLPDLDTPNGRGRGFIEIVYDLPGRPDRVLRRPLALVRGRMDGRVRWEGPAA